MAFYNRAISWDPILVKLFNFFKNTTQEWKFYINNQEALQVFISCATTTFVTSESTTLLPYINGLSSSNIRFWHCILIVKFIHRMFLPYIKYWLLQMRCWSMCNIKLHYPWVYITQNFALLNPGHFITN